MENQKTDKNNNGENTGTVKNENQNFLKVYVYYQLNRQLMKNRTLGCMI